MKKAPKGAIKSAKTTKADNYTFTYSSNILGWKCDTILTYLALLLTPSVSCFAYYVDKINYD